MIVPSVKNVTNASRRGHTERHHQQQRMNASWESVAMLRSVNSYVRHIGTSVIYLRFFPYLYDSKQSTVTYFHTFYQLRSAALFILRSTDDYAWQVTRCCSVSIRSLRMAGEWEARRGIYCTVSQWRCC
jgi:hypothetical protein